jgi:hypothetical protein
MLSHEELFDKDGFLRIPNYAERRQEVIYAVCLNNTGSRKLHCFEATNEYKNLLVGDVFSSRGKTYHVKYIKDE